MPLNIKNERVTELAQQLAKLTGESITDAVGVAIEDRLIAVRAKQDQEERYRRAMELIDEMSPAFKEFWDGKDINEVMYDENGLPKW